MIYFIADTESRRIKIGTASYPWRRLASVQTGSSAELVMMAIEPGDADREAELHRHFAADRIRGEWFRASADLEAYMQALGRPERPVVHAHTRSFWGGMTAAQVARATGLSKAQISEIQAGKSRPSPEAAIRLQRATGKSAIALVFGGLAREAA